MSLLTAAASLKLLLDVTEICDVSDDRREWPLCTETSDLESVSISLEESKKMGKMSMRFFRKYFSEPHSKSYKL